MPTSSTIPDSDAYNWVIAPVGRCILAVGEGAKIGGLLHRAIIALSNQGPLLDAVHRVTKAAGRSDESIQRLIAQQPGLEKWSKELLADDLHPLHTSGIVALWASLEVAVEDTATLILMKDPTATATVMAAGVRLPSPMSNPVSEIDARRVFSRFDRLASGTRNVSQAYCHVLQTLGIDIVVDAVVHAKVAELNYVRNCVLHRGGIVDERVADEAPGLGLSSGAKVQVGQAAYLGYFEAVSKFVLALSGAALKSRHVRTK